MNLKQKIKNVIESGKADDKLSTEIASAKNKFAGAMDYEMYNKLSDIEHSLYRYNTFVKNDMSNYAEKEGKVLMNLAEDNIVLKGGISNTKYIWRTEPNACKKCQDLDGTTYDHKEDIPEKPHPNCKCHIEEERDNEACEYCVSNLEKFEETLSKAQLALSKAYSIMRELFTFALSDISTGASEKINPILDGFVQEGAAYADFLSSYLQLLNFNKQKYHEGSPEYFHQKANCQAAQRGEIGEATAIVVGRMREFIDYYKDVYIKGKTVEEAEYNNQYDYKQNAIGRQIGRENPDGDCEEILKGRIKIDWQD